MQRRMFIATVTGVACLGWQPGPALAVDCLPTPANSVLDEASGVFVQWVGPSGCPQFLDAPGDDFTVDTQTEPPSVYLHTLQKNGVAVTDYVVGRTPGTDGQPRDLQIVQSWWGASTADTTEVTVRVGTAAGYPVRSIHDLIVNRPTPVGGNNPWSSCEVKLQKDIPGNGGHLTGTVAVQPNTESPPKGGRVLGTIAGNQGDAASSTGTIGAFAIGEGEGGGSPGSRLLTIGGEVRNLEFETFPTEALLDAGHLRDGEIKVTGPLLGEMRFRRIGTWCQPTAPFPICATNPGDDPKITIEAIDPDDPSGPRLPSTGKIFVSKNPPDANGFPTGGTPGPIDPDGICVALTCQIDGDFAGILYAWSFQLQYNLTGMNNITIGRSMANGETMGHLTDGASIRSFRGNYSAPQLEEAVDFVQIVVYGDMKSGSTIDLGGQMAFDSKIDISRNVESDATIQTMYLYADFHGTNPATVRIGGDLGGTIKTSNMVVIQGVLLGPRSCFLDSGKVIIVGDVLDGGVIQHTGHVGDMFLAEIGGDLAGHYQIHSNGVNKMYAGRLHVKGDVTSTGVINITSSLDRMRQPELGGGRIDIDGDCAGQIALLQTNDPPCQQTQPGELLCLGYNAAHSGSCCPAIGCCDVAEDPDCEEPEDCCEPAGPTVDDLICCSDGWDEDDPCCGQNLGMYVDNTPGDPVPALNPDFCCSVCSCPGSTDFVPDLHEHNMQQPGSITIGHVKIGRKLTGSISLAGDIGEDGWIEVGSLEGGSITLNDHADGPAGIRAGGRIKVNGAFTAGSITIAGTVAGTLSTGAFGTSTTSPTITLQGALASTGKIDILGLMQRATIALNTFSGATDGAITIRANSTNYTPVSGDVDVGDINVTGSFDGTFTADGCFQEPCDRFISFCKNGGGSGTTLTSFCTGATATVACVP